MHVFLLICNSVDPLESSTSSSHDTPLPQTPTTSTSASLQYETKRLDAGAPTFSPRFLPTAASEPSICTTPVVSTPPLIEKPSPSPSPSTAPSTVASDDESDILTDNDDPNAEYVRLKLKHYRMQTQQHLHPTDKKMRQLHQRISLLWGDALFDERVAENEWRSEKAKVDMVNLQSRLRSAGSDPPKACPGAARNKKSKGAPLVPSTPKKATTEDDDEESMGLDLFDAPQESTSDGRVILMKEMIIPKHSAKTPKTLLRDCVFKLDKYAAITYTIVSGGSRAVRASATISWEGKRRDDWVMEDVACPKDDQAEQYVATVALHALTFPQTDGFAAGNYSSAGSLTFFRSLPPSFRDLWDELEAKRKERDDEINRNLWTKLRALANAKCEAASKRSGKLAKTSNATTTNGARRYRSSQAFDSQLAESFAQRQASYAYQEMLEQRNTLPIAAYRNTIIETLEESQVVVLSGETGWYAALRSRLSISLTEIQW